MIINNSKKALAAKIRNSGFVWPDSGKWAIQDKDGEVFVCSGTSVPVRRMGEVNWEFGEPYRSVGILSLGSNWFQCILSRDEYFHLYPAPDADGWIEWAGGECPVHDGELVDYRLLNGGECLSGQVASDLLWSHKFKGANIIAYRLHKPEIAPATQEPAPEPVVEAKPTIEQLATEYRNRQDYAERKQQEADEAKAEAEAKLAELVAAGKSVGLAVSVAAPEPELVITDWRDLREGDEVEVFDFECPEDNAVRKGELMGGVCVVMSARDGVVHIERNGNLPNKGLYWNATGVDACKFTFIRRPAKEADNA